MLCVNPTCCTYLHTGGQSIKVNLNASQGEQYTLHDEYEEAAERMPVL